MTSSLLLDYLLSHLAIFFSFDFLSAAEVFSISLQHAHGSVYHFDDIVFKVTKVPRIFTQ